MKRAFLLALSIGLSLYTFAQPPQEICNNGIDDDFDGFIDCYDGSCASSPLCDGIFLGNDAACNVPKAQFPLFTMTIDFTSPDETTNHLSRLAIGDLDRDGMPEMVTMNRYTRKLFILKGSDGSIKNQLTVTWEPYWEVAIANIDNDSCGEIYFIGYQDNAGTSNDGVFFFAYDCSLNFLWQSQKLRGDPINYGLADFDGDGKVELYAKDEIYDAKTGTRIVKSTGTTYSRINGGPIAANILGDSKLELVIGLNIYQVNLGARTADAGSLTLLQGRTDYFTRNEYNATSVADFNQDGFIDVLASGSTGSNGANTTVFFWDVQNNTIKTYSDPQPGLGSDYTNGWKNGTGRLNVADLDGDGDMNVSYVSGRFLYALDENFNLFWRATINEETSGHTGCTLFDFNGDGKSEIVYRDEQYVYIINGTDGTNYQNPQRCISRTNREYPIVADVDADGSTEICVTCGTNDVTSWSNFGNLSNSRYSQVRVFKSASEPWVPARRVWNQHGYYVVNVNDDLSIPTNIQAHHLVWSTGNCTQGPNRPLNKFLNQAPFLSSEGCPTYAAPNLSFSTDQPVVDQPTCPDVDFTVSMQVVNHGDVSITGNFPISFYTTNPKRAGSTKLNTINIPVTDFSPNDTLFLNNMVVNGIGADSLYIVLNDDGSTIPSPITIPNANIVECSYTDNIIGVRVIPKRVSITALPVSPNDQCAPGGGAVRAYVPFPVGTENTTDYNFYWSNGAVAKPIASADFLGAIYSGIPDGPYTVYARHKTANCSSDTATVNVDLVSSAPDVSINIISHQTVCDPPDGELQASVVGGNAGFAFDWYDGNLNPLSISGPTATNLTAGNYIVIATKNGCNDVSLPVIITGPSGPDVQTETLQHVVDCTNLNSGSVSAAATISGVPQNPAGYSFDWYFYDNVTSTRGSILPPIHGSGPTRTGLPVGYYEVVVTDNATQCASTTLATAQITSATNLPSASITEVAPQTSCDPSQPNGILTASATATGLTSPNDFTFEWFKGDNTLPANLVTTVSGLKGETVNQVAGGGVFYTVKVTTPNNCSATAKLIISENVIQPVVTLTSTPNSVCDISKATNPYNGTVTAAVTFNGSGVSLPDNNYVFTWHSGPAISDPTITVTDNKNPVLSGLIDGTYSVTVSRNDLHCVSNPVSRVVPNATVLPALSTSSTGSNNCDASLTPDGTATVSVTNSVVGDVFQYQWYNGNAVTVGQELSTTVNNAQQTTAIKLGGPVGAPKQYTIYVLNKTTGCENNAIQSVADVSSIPVLSLGPIVPNRICSPATLFNGEINVVVNNIPTGYTIADYTFTWKDTVPAVISGFTGTKLDKRDAGAYTAQAINTKTGCTSAPISGQVPNAKVLPAISIATTGSHNCDPLKTADGTATATITNALVGETFGFAWTAVAPATAITNGTNNANTATAIRLGGPTNAPNSYQVTVTNNSTGCVNTNTGMVADNSQKPTLVLQPFDNSICDKNLVTVGSAQYNGHVDVTSVNNNVGTYSGPVTLAYQWFDVNTITSALTANTTSPTNTTASLTQLDNGKYAASITISELGCTSNPVIAEVLDNQPTVSITTQVAASTNCAPAKPGNGSAQVTFVNGTAVGVTTDYSYEWYNGATVSGAVIGTNALLGSNLQGTSTYTVRATNKTNGCRGNVAVTVSDAKVTPTIAVSLVKNNTVCDITTINPDGELLATVNAGTNFSINWTGGVAPATTAGTNGERYVNLKSGSYSATVTNNDTGCQSASSSNSVMDNLTYPVVAATVTPQTSCGAPNGRLDGTADGTTNTALYNFDWFDGAGTGTPHATAQVSPGAINQLAAADYTIRVKRITTGCVSTLTRTVPNTIVIPTLSMTGVNAVTNCGGTVNGQATVSIAGLSAPTNYDIYYVYTPDSKGGAVPTDPADIKTSVDPTKHTYSNLLNQGAAPTAYLNMAPGFLTALVIDKNTSCEASPISQQIIDNSTKSTISVNIVPSPGICSAGNGGLDATVVSVPATPMTVFTYDWYVGTPNNTGTINFFDNPPTFSTASIYADKTINRKNLGKNSTPMDNTIGPGPYTLVIRNPTTGCGAYVTTTVTTGTSPVIATSKVDVTDCSAGNGQIQATVTSGLSPSGYSIEVFAGNSKTGAPIATSGGFQPVNTVLTATTLPAGPYFIEIIDGNHPTCPMGRGVVLTQQVYSPVITVNNIIANTSCTPGTSADGKVQLTVTNNANDTQAKSYYISNISPLPVGFVLNPSPGNIIGTGASGQSTGLMNGFQSLATVPSYTITVTDDLGNCSNDVVVSIPDQQSLPSDLNLGVTPETLCAPSSNGSAVVSLSNAEAITRFDFSWSSTNTMGAIVFGPTAGSGGTAGELLNQSKTIPANWTMGLTGTGSGERKFYVQGIKNATSPSGVGCKTPIKEVVIPDQHISPALTLTSAINSYCLSTAANGLVGDGSITIAADADPNTVGQQNAAGGFNYAWTNANAAMTSPKNAQSNNFVIPQLGTGAYQVTATNATNQCNVVRDVNVDAAPYTVAVAANTLVDQRICLNDGDITITQINIKDGNGNNILSESNATLNTKYNFLWYKANSATPSTFDASAGQELADFAATDITSRTLGIDIDQIAEAGEYQAMGAGTYYVVATRSDNAALGFGCTSLPYRVDVQDIHQNPAAQLEAFSNTSCLPGVNEGEIKISVTDNTNAVFKPVAGFVYQYTWSGPAPIPPVNPGSGNGNADGTDGDNDHYQNLADDTNPYTVTVLNNQSGCSTIASATIIKNATPVFVQDVLVGNQNICGPDGSLTVAQVTLNDRNGNSQSFTTSSAPSIDDFDFDWSRSASAFVQTTSGATPPANILNVANYNTGGFGVPMGFDTYTVVARRRTGSPGAGCPSAPFAVEIKDNRIYPVVTLTPFANTSCSLNPAMAEGEITVSVSDASVIAGPFTYTYAWDNINNPSNIATALAGTNDGDNFGGGELQAGVPDNDEDHPTVLLHGNYAITVTNNQTQCSSTGSTTMFQNSTPVFTQSVTPTDQVLCNPDGSLTVNEVKLIDRNGNIQSNLNGDFPLTDFQFKYDRGTVGNTVVAISASPVVNSGNYPAIGFDSYYVVASRITGNPGLDCPSAPFKVDILDKRLFPKVDFTSIPNSSCNPGLSNGTVVVNASEQNGTNTDTYNIAWLFNSNPVAASAFTNNSSTVTSAQDGSYTVTATNTATGCPINGTFDLILDQTRSTPNIIDVTSIDPVDCNPTGQAAVTKITIGSASGSILIPPGPTNEVTGAGLLAYNFEWYANGTTPADKLAFTTPCVGAGCAPPTAGLLPGTYFVTVQDPTTDCISGPREVVISEDDIINPVVSITQTAKQIMCSTTVGSGQLVASAIEENGTTGTYNFEWFPTLDLTGVALAPVSAANPNTIGSLLTGDYSVRVQNTTTNCVSSALFIVPDESALYTPVLSFAGQPRTLCVGLDGELSVKVINLDAGYPFPINLTADLYFGLNPNLSNPPDVPNMPGNGGSPISFVSTGLADGDYTVRITDNNTQCESVGDFKIEDMRVTPAPVVDETSPNTNCAPFEGTGVASVTVNGTFLGYTFDWYEGTAVSGTPVYSGAEFNKLKPILYTVQATDTRTGCVGTVQATITDGALPIPVPFIDKLSDVTSCIAPNGALTAYVGLDKNTADYIFNWYDGIVETPTSDFVGENYEGLAVGIYSVTATSRITGCKSPLVNESVIENKVLPDLDVIARNSSCTKEDGSIVLLVNSNVPIEKIEWEDGNGPISVGPNLMEISSGTYTAIVTSIMGCVAEKEVTIIADIRPYNGISRNNDTQNEFFKIDCIEDYPDNIVKIYNRVGTLVYEGQKYDNSNIFFDGKSNKGVSPFGNNLPDGTYFYIIDKNDGSKPLSGYLEIVN